MKRILLILLPVLQILPANSDETDILQTILKNPILPIQLGHAKIIYTKHTFLHYLDLEPIILQLENIEKYFLKIKNSFISENPNNPISYQGLTENGLLRTNFLIQTTQDKLENLHPHMRNKRGLINIVGKANKWLFGTLDADDGKRYDQAILKLQQNQKNTIKELNLQMSLSKNLIDNYNKTISILSSNQKTLEHSLNTFQAVVQTSINNLNSYITFQGILSQINLDCQNIITFMDNLEDAIMFAKLNTLHNSIISSLELKQIIDYLKTIYSENQIPKFENILSYYQIFGTQVTFSKTKLIFAIHVPIIKPETFTFYHLYPVIQNNKVIIPKYPYLAQTFKEVQFEENTCPSLEETYYCPEQFHPPDSCTLQLIKSTSTTGCQILEINVEESILEQVTPKEVLILPTRKEKIFAQCKTDQYLEIEVPTLIKIPIHCSIEANNKKFIHDVKLQQGKPLLLPTVEIAKINTTRLYQTPNYTKINFEEIYRLKDLTNQLTPIQEIDGPIIESSTIISIVTLSIIVIVLFVIIRKKQIILNYLRRKSNQSKKSEDIDDFQNRSSILSA